MLSPMTSCNKRNNAYSNKCINLECCLPKTSTGHSRALEASTSLTLFLGHTTNWFDWSLFDLQGKFSTQHAFFYSSIDKSVCKEMGSDFILDEEVKLPPTLHLFPAFLQFFLRDETRGNENNGQKWRMGYSFGEKERCLSKTKMMTRTQTDISSGISCHREYT